MAKGQFTIHVRFEALGSPVTGQWCDSCLLPSKVQLPGIFTLGESITTVTLEFCTDCGRHGLARQAVIAGDAGDDDFDAAPIAGPQREADPAE